MAEGSTLPLRKPRQTERCGHFEQVKAGSNWKCVACGRILTMAESVQNSLELSEVMRSMIDGSRTLNESLDELFGRKEWEEIRAKIPQSKKSNKRHKGRPVKC